VNQIKRPSGILFNGYATNPHEGHPIEVVEPFSRALQATIIDRLDQLVHQAGGGGEADLQAFLAGGQAETEGEVRLAVCGFWHRHEGCRYTTTPSTRQEFWQGKFAANVARDAAVSGKLLEDGWRVATVWECALRKPDQMNASADLLSAWLRSDERQFQIGEEEARRS